MFKIFFVIFEGKWPRNSRKAGKLSFWLICSSLLLMLGCGSGGGGETGSPVGTSPGTATLSWDAPTTNEDGTPLNDLAGYNIYYGTSSGNYTSSADAGNFTTYTVTGLSGGITYYFAVTASNASGESVYSNEVCYNSSGACP